MVSPGRVCFTIFGIDIMWYGVLIASAMVLGILICYGRAPKYDINRDRLLDVLLVSVPCGIIGARVYYVIFEWSYYSHHVNAIWDIRGGGLAIHGGLIAGFAVGALLSKRWGISVPGLLDLIAPCVALGQAIGRWGNFFNSEAHGCETDLPWAILVNGKYVHPTFLYESIWCFILFIFLMWLEYRQYGRPMFMNEKEGPGVRSAGFAGQYILLYGMLYSFERFWVESLRTDSLMIGPLRQAQVLSLVIIIGCLIIYLMQRKRCGNRS